MEHKSDVNASSSSCWVVEMEKMLEDAKPSVEMARWNRHSIYRVPQFIKDMTNSEAYSPRFVSLGPLNHGESYLLPMEEHKRRAVLHMVNRSGKPLQEFVAAIDEVADELRAAYNDLGDDWRGSRFVEMMVMDGCFVLEWIRAHLGRRGKADKDYATNDPIFSNHGCDNLWATVRIDMICMENQIPLVLLQSLLAVQRGTSVLMVKAEEINSMVLCVLDGPNFVNDMDKLGLHLLDIYHRSYSGICPQWEGDDSYEPRTPCAIELSEAGIEFRESKTNNIHAVDFENGVLSMPLFKVADQTEARLLNLMAFEQLHPDANSYVRAYISFLDKIVKSEKDVALLRSRGLFANSMGSDTKVVEMFNTLTKLAERAMPGSKLGHVMWKLNRHCEKPWNKWRANFMNTYVSNPWVITSMVAASILLVATLMQTVYTVVPFYTKG